MMFKRYSALTICLALAACGAQKIDDRQTEVIQGLVYKHGDKDPFTGIVTNSRALNSFVGYTDGCSISYKDGVVAGEADCFAGNGVKVLEVHFTDERKSGIEKHWNAANGKLNYQASWDAGNKDGVEKIYDGEGKTLRQEITWKEGARSGAEKAWSDDGTLITSLEWTDGKKSGKETTVNGSTTVESNFDEGQLSGPQKETVGSVSVKESTYDHGLLDGTQTYFRFGLPEVVRKWKQGKMLSETIARHLTKEAVYETDQIECAAGCEAGDADAREISMQGATNMQVQFFQVAPPGYVPPYVPITADGADDSLLDREDGMKLLRMFGFLGIKTINTPDFSQLAKLQTPFKNDEVEGVQKGWDAAGNLILQAIWKNNSPVSAQGSLIGASAPSGDPSTNGVETVTPAADAPADGAEHGAGGSGESSSKVPQASAIFAQGDCVYPKTKPAPNGGLAIAQPIYVYSEPNAAASKQLLTTLAAFSVKAVSDNGYVQLTTVPDADKPDLTSGATAGWAKASDFEQQALRNCN
jgi:antitoxin component YwqK of YwqJK toxin-antitoxin module